MKPLVHKVSENVAADLWSKRVDTESFLSELRRLGAFKVESVGTLRRLANISLSEAKEKVHFSKTWEDTREADDTLHEDVAHALSQAGYIESQEPRLQKLAS